MSAECTHCHHQHTGRNMAYICIGCPCPVSYVGTCECCDRDTDDDGAPLLLAHCRDADDHDVTVMCCARCIAELSVST